MNIDLKPCPVCGGEMKLGRVDRAIKNLTKQMMLSSRLRGVSSAHGDVSKLRFLRVSSMKPMMEIS